MEDQLLTQAEAAARLKIPPRRLEAWRCKGNHGKGPPFVKMGRTVFYLASALKEWVAAGGTKGGAA